MLMMSWISYISFRPFQSSNHIILLIMDKEGEERIVRILNESFGKGRNPSVTALGGRIVHFDSKMMDFAMIFIGKDEFCE